MNRVRAACDISTMRCDPYETDGIECVRPCVSVYLGDRHLDILVG
jgi:hypothetical protein